VGLRETLNENPGITTAATAIIILGAVVFVVLSVMRGDGADAGTGGEKAYFSDDDGKSFFVDERTKVPPFDRNGKPAVRAQLFTCDGGKTKFVGWLERYTPEAKKRLENQIQQNGGKMPMVLEDEGGVEMKKPGTGEKGWVKRGDPAVEQITDVRCPDGSKENVEPVPNP
jgi:hypothetical protein